MEVHTENSRYIVDFANTTVTRTPLNPGELRRDREQVEIEHMCRPVTGEPWRMQLNIRRDGVSTLRVTSPVTFIDGLDEWRDQVDGDEMWSPAYGSQKASPS